ncbi:NucA/NucB deoxyribonuclease domain-containing protein [Streptomyces phaeochromogenes]|uniref:NucA/NucB deoxyribonuclease domain-containing protein n=1 Tax=Streptomyces phaeochromogenes TaxID=1923 RepID=UPI002E27D72A|nr:NucA/NucB deoxyribonuclease domain-containing protein [Streptomyces phaeochromogenes]
MGLRRRLLSVLLAVMGTAAVLAAPQAAAAIEPSRSVTGYFTDTPLPSPADTFQRLKSGESARSIGLTGGTGKATASAVHRTGPEGVRGVQHNVTVGEPVPPAGLAPRVVDDPQRTMTLAECKAHTANDASMWIASRFAMCESRWFAAEWSVNGKVVGFTQMTVSAIATVPAADSREIYFDYYFSDFYAAGTNAIDATLVGADPNYVTAPDNIALTQGGLDPGPRSVAQIKADPHFMVSRRAEPGQGLAPDDGVWAIWNMKFEPQWPAPWVETNPLAEWKFSSFGLRWDNSSYLPNYKPADVLHTGGASLSYNMSPLRYSTAATAEEQAVALHIEKAFTQPAGTQPVNPSKHVLGQSASKPLHRLQKGISQTHLNRYNANRREAVKVCTAVDPEYASKGLQCDEYPFASTYEGSARSIYEPGTPANNFSALAVDGGQNGKAGNQLAAYYDKSRIIDGENDEFYVVIIS